ncbi:MAG: hypothetical protein Q7K40_04315 [bacterium]|nr:hypothetical protein [bacterium]
MAPSKLKRVFSDLILEGINITRQAQEGDAIYAEKNILDEVFSRYQIWKSDIKDFLTMAKRDNIEFYKFYEADSVPNLKGGIEYSNIQSEESQTLLKNIRTETSKHLNLLKEAGDDVFNKKLPKTTIVNPSIITLGRKNKLTFNTITGDTTLGKVKVNFKADQQKFNVLKTLLNANEKQASYKDLCNALGFPLNKTEYSDIGQIIKTIKEDLQILPEGCAVNTDIFHNIEKVGFRIIVE